MTLDPSSPIPEIHVVDSGYVRDHFDAVHLLVHNGRVAVIDPATRFSVPRILRGLAERGLTPEAVDWILLTHVHLDHAGGTGDLLACCPNARVAVHARGERHLVAPEKLWAAVCQVYGQAEAESLYGGITPVPAERIQVVGEGDRLSLAGREILIWDTPGHALHHVVYEDTTSRSLFAGDTYGIQYPSLRGPGGALAFITSSPSQFDPDSHAHTLHKLMSRQPQQVYLTHYGSLPDPLVAGQRLLAQLPKYAEIAVSAPRGESRRETIREGLLTLYVEEAQTLGLQTTRNDLAEALAMDLDLNADGLLSWLARTETQTCTTTLPNSDSRPPSQP